MLETVDASFALHQRSAYASFLRFFGAVGDDYGAAELIYGELVGNAIRHAGGAISVAVDWRAPVAILAVTDTGAGFEFRGAHSSGPDAECGRGLFIVAHLCRGLSVERLPGGGCRVTATLPISRRERGAHHDEYPDESATEAVA